MFLKTEERPQGEQQVGKLKLSEAIRIGAKCGPQIRGSYFDHNGGSCAMGAAIKGGAPIPPENLQREIVWRNDSLNWTRESIADWLEAQGL